MATGIRWNGENVRRVIGERALGRLRNAAEETRDYLKEKVSKPYPPSGPKGGYPALRSGAFKASIRYRAFRQRVAVQISSNILYAPYLEFGTRFSAPRPAFRIAMRKFRERLFKAGGRRASVGVR